MGVPGTASRRRGRPRRAAQGTLRRAAAQATASHAGRCQSRSRTHPARRGESEAPCRGDEAHCKWRRGAASSSGMLDTTKRQSKARSPDEGGNQRSSEAVQGNQGSSEVISGQRKARSPSSPRAVMRSHQRSSEVISGHQRSSAVIRGHQRSSPPSPRAPLRSRSRRAHHRSHRPRSSARGRRCAAGAPVP